MSNCWYCHWGWPIHIIEIFDEAKRRLGGDSYLLSVAAHIVWDEENFNLAKRCLEQLDKYQNDLSEEELAVIRWSLEELDKLPDEIKVEPDEYWEDDDNPDKYPPKFETRFPNY